MDLLARMERRLEQREIDLESSSVEALGAAPPTSVAASTSKNSKAPIQELEQILRAGENVIELLAAIRRDLRNSWPFAALSFVLSLIIRVELSRWRAKRMMVRVKQAQREIALFKNKLERFNHAYGRPLPISRFVTSKEPLHKFQLRDSYLFGISSARRVCKDSILEIQLQQERIKELKRELENG